jgi:arylsulfatase A-like enzyme
MRAILMMFDSLNRHMLTPYAETLVDAPNFARLAARAVTFDSFYAGSMPCMPARRELHTGRYNFLHRSWGPIEPFDDSMPEMLSRAGIHTHLISDHPHYWEDGGATFHTRYTTWEGFRGQEGDPWKALVSSSTPSSNVQGRMLDQDKVNRSYMPSEAKHVQTLTVDAGVHFLETNKDADDWLLQLELFDPHEPFFAPDAYKARYLAPEADTGFDWPGYRKVTEPASLVAEARAHYAALVTMCDHSLGRVLDFMDAHDLWADTMLIVNTDHGFLLSEHGWWAKSVQPWFNELVHLPMFMWDPRTAGRDTRRAALAQTIDIPPTLLSYFGVEPTVDMQGRDLAAVLETDARIHEGGLFGIFGGHVNVTDGRYVYMRAAAAQSNSPLVEHTLMPTHMRSRFGVEELKDWEPAAPFTFTKGLRTISMTAAAGWMNPWSYGTLLYDVSVDPQQLDPIVDDDVELDMLRLLASLLHDSDAPASQFERLGIPLDGEPGVEHLLVRQQRARTAAMAEPLTQIDLLPAADLLRTPIAQLQLTPRIRAVLAEHLPFLSDTELITAPTDLSIADLASHALITNDQLITTAEALATLPN